MQLTANTKQLSGPETFPGPFRETGPRDGFQIEKTHLQFCKSYLEVNNKASNIACRTKLGCFPLNIILSIKKSSTTFCLIYYIQSKDEEYFVMQSFFFGVIWFTLQW